MRIEYETTLADLKAWNRFTMRQPRIRRYLLEQRCWKAAFVAFAIFLILFSNAREYPQAVGTAAGTFVVLVLGMWYVDTRALQRNFRWETTRYPALAGLGRRTLEIGDDKLTEASDQHAISLQWSLIERIVYQPRYLYFILLNQSAIVVPLEAIQPAADRERFLDFLRRCAPPDLRKVIPESTVPEGTSPVATAPNCAS